MDVSHGCAHAHRPIVADRHHHRHVHDGGDNGHSHHHEEVEHRPHARHRLTIACAVTVAFMAVEIIGGFWTGSIALLGDAVHMCSHAMALGVSVLAVTVANRRVDSSYPFGLFRIEVLAAACNAATLVVFAAWIAWTAVERFVHPVPVQSMAMVGIATLGLLANLGTAWLLHAVSREDLNTRSAFAHLLADTASSVAIIVGGVAMFWTEWTILDPILGVVVALVTLRWAWQLLAQVTRILLERAPPEFDLPALDRDLRMVATEVTDVHDVHVWEITSGFLCATAHVVVGNIPTARADVIRASAAAMLEHRYGIAHATLQCEAGT
ncbi:MAG: cation diffusion facilitator family transporter [bacterium]|nr:cation diffusion facilitator family transporter [bacterium]